VESEDKRKLAFDGSKKPRKRKGTGFRREKPTASDLTFLSRAKNSRHQTRKKERSRAIRKKGSEIRENGPHQIILSTLKHNVGAEAWPGFVPKGRAQKDKKRGWASDVCGGSPPMREGVEKPLIRGMSPTIHFIQRGNTTTEKGVKSHKEENRTRTPQKWLTNPRKRRIPFPAHEGFSVKTARYPKACQGNRLRNA